MPSFACVQGEKRCGSLCGLGNGEPVMESKAMMVNERMRLVARTHDSAPSLDLTKKRHPGETLIQGFLFLCGFMTIFTTIAIVIVLGRESLLLVSSNYVDEGGTVHTIGVLDFVNTTRWQPHRYEVGIAPLATATLLSSAIAMLVALPLGLGSAIYLSEYASPRVCATIKPILEVLAGVPTVVYGFFALQFMTRCCKVCWAATWWRSSTWRPPGW